MKTDDTYNVLLNKLKDVQRRVETALVGNTSYSPREMLDIAVVLEELREQNDVLAVSHEALIEAHQRYHDLFEFAPDGYVVTDMHGIIQEANTAMTRMLGVSQAYLKSLPLRLFVAFDARRDFLNQMSQFQTGQAESIQEWDVLMQPRKGKSFHAAVSVRTIRDAVGTARGLRWIVHDISVRVYAQEALRQSEQFTRSVLGSLEDRVVVLDETGNIITVNQAWWDFAAVNSLDFTHLAEGANYLLVCDAICGNVCAEATAFANAIRCVLMGERTQSSLEYSCHNPTTQEERWFIGRITHLAGEGPQRIVVTHTDITHIKQVEAELQAARQIAEAATRDKAAFLATMSHEIRTPLNAIIGMTTMVEQTTLNPSQQEYVEIIRISSDSLLRLINNILDFSKIEAGKLVLEHEPFSLRTCIEESLELVAAAAAQKGLVLAYMVDEQTPEDLIGDPTRVRQLLLNLLSNAVKFTQQGEVVVSVTSTIVSPQPSGINLHVSVRDTGIGIPEDLRNRIFQAFSQADISTTRTYGGTGLGLAICQRLVNLMGGTIGFESAVGHGSTFHVSFVAEVAPPTPHPFLVANQPLLVGKHVLIVDENLTRRTIVTNLAQRWGMQPIAISSAPAALMWLQQGQRCDMAILNTGTTKPDSLPLAEQLLVNRASSPLPIVSYVSVGTPHTNDAAAAGKNVVLVNPVRPALLYKALISLIQKQPFSSPRVPEQEAIDHQMGQRYPLRILLVEDDRFSQQVAQYFLKSLGYEVVDVAANGLEALTALAHRTYDVILMDAQMPEMDGITATQHIRVVVPEDQQPWIIALTAYALEGDRESFLATGMMDDYLEKPLILPHLAAVLQRAVHQVEQRPRLLHQ